MTERRDLVDEAGRMSVRRQCELLGIARSGLCHECRPETPANLKIMRRLDEMHQERPVYGCDQKWRSGRSEGESCLWCLEPGKNEDAGRERLLPSR